MGSNPKWTVPPYIGLTTLLCVLSKSLKAKPTSGTTRSRPATVVVHKEKDIIIDR